MNVPSPVPRIWVVIPAAGVGQRMAAPVPKQYLPLAGTTVLQQTVSRFDRHPRVDGIVVVVSPDDVRWGELAASMSDTVTAVHGGAERCHSVRNALEALGQYADEQDWVLVHDAARPCVRVEDIDCLLAELEGDQTGGLLAVPVRDTMKRADAGNRVRETVDREGLWHALTPQMFRLGMLHAALSDAIEAGIDVTDEASAMEYDGHRPLLVEGHSDNIKITRQEDLALAQFLLERQKEP